MISVPWSSALSVPWVLAQLLLMSLRRRKRWGRPIERFFDPPPPEGPDELDLALRAMRERSMEEFGAKERALLVDAVLADSGGLAIPTISVGDRDMLTMFTGEET